MIQNSKKWLVIPALMVVALILGAYQSQSAVVLADSPQQSNTLTVGSASVDAGTSGAVDISLNNTDAVASSQIEISYDNSNGVTLTGVNPTGRATGFQTNFSESTSGSTTSVTILMFNLTGSTIDAGDGAVLTLDFTTTGAAVGTTALIVDTVLLSNSSGGALTSSGVDGSISINGTLPPEPAIVSVSPNRATQDDSLTVQITGSNVDWTANAPTNVSLGAGVTVNSTSVVNATTLSAAISIDAAASAGPRDVTVVISGGADLTLSNGFTVQGPGIGIIMPTDVEGYPGGSVTIPVSVTTDVTGEGILAYGFTLTFSPTIRLQSVSQDNTLSDNNWSVTLNRGNGEARIVAFSSVAMAGTGTLLNLTFEVSPGAEVGTETDIVFSEFRFNEGEPASQTDNGHMTIIMQPGTIEGCVTPVHDFSQVVAGLPISFTNMVSGAQDTVTTGDDGCYSASIEPGDYVAAPAKTGVISDSLNVWDSIQIALHDVQQDESDFSPHQLTVCDVTQDGTCTGFDAAQIALYRIDPALTTSIAGQFVSDPFSRTHALGGGDSLTGQDYELYLAGDVTLDWPASVQSQAVVAAARTQAIVVTLPSATTIEGGTLTLPVTVANAGQKGMLGYELFISFDQEVLTIEEVNNEGSVARDTGWVFQQGVTDAGEIRVVSYGTSQLESDGVLFNIVATVHGDIEGQTPLTVSHLMFNDGQPETTGVDGQIVVEQFVINSTNFLPIVSR
ncbi:MAG: cohesin domain-containing protein [Chloroflexota bacterium]